MRRSQKSRNRPAKPKKYNTNEPVTFLEHVYEFRVRLTYIIVALVVGTLACFQYKDTLVWAVMQPLHGQKLIYLTPGGGFSFIFTICLYGGLLLAIPIVMYHIFRFLQPLVGSASRRFVAGLLLVSSLLAAAGALFGYAVAIPAALDFLSAFAGDAVSPSLTAESYLNFVVAYMFGLAALFQLPLLVIMLDHVRPLPPGRLLASQRFIIIGAVIAAAIITPTPDVVNQLIVAGPIIAIYQLGALVVYARRTVRLRQHKLPAVQEVRVESDMPATSARLQQSSARLPAPVAAPSHRASQRRSVDGFVRAVTSDERCRMSSCSTPPSVASKQRSIDGIVRV